MATSLFREQVVERRRQRLYGEVILLETRIGSRVVVAIGAVSAALISWAAMATYPRTEKVPGVVVTTEPSAKIFAARSGVLERVYVHEGAVVKQGQPLLFIGVDIRDATQRGAADQSLAALEQQSVSVIQRTNAAERTAADARVSLKAALATNVAEQRSLQTQLGIQADIVQSKTEELSRLDPAASAGYISRLEMDRQRQQLLRELQQVEQIKQQLVQLDSRRVDLEARLRQLPLDGERQAAELQRELGAIAQQQSRAKVDVGYMVVAPIDGLVTALQASVGREVGQRVPLMAIVPQQATFQVRLYAASRAVGFLHERQEVRIAYDAFPYKQFGSFGGTIESIARTAYAPGEADIPLKLEEATYPITVELSNEVVPAFGRALPLQSGMTLTASVVLERRSFLDWLLQPLNAVRRRT